MLWPTLILSAHAVTFAPKALKFPSRATPPAHVVSAQLDALRRNDIAKTYDLFSRARRLAIDEAARGDARHYEVSREVVLQKLEMALRESCPGLLGHDRYEISSSLAIREYDGVHLPQWRCRVRCLTGPSQCINQMPLTEVALTARPGQRCVVVAKKRTRGSG